MTVVFEHEGFVLSREAKGFVLLDSRGGETRRGFRPLVQGRRSTEEQTVGALKWAIDVAEGRVEL